MSQLIVLLGGSYSVQYKSTLSAFVNLK